VFLGGGLGVTGGANDLGSGVYDEFRIYNVALSESEILYNALGVPEPASVVVVGMGAALLLAGTRGRIRR
jgi:hypothetical protein